MGRSASPVGRWYIRRACACLFVVGLCMCACSGGRSTGSAASASSSTSASSSEPPASAPACPPPCSAGTGHPPPPPTGPPGPPIFTDPSVPNVGPAGLSGSVGTPFSGLVASVASGPCGCSARIAWGDSSEISDGAAKSNDRGGVDITGSHTYDSAGTYSILVDVSLCASEPCHGAPTRETVQQTITIS